jgi:sporulation protein YlmC with PRC-barrel domain
MRTKHLVAALFASTILSAPALAQNAPANQPANPPAATTQAAPAPAAGQNETVMKSGQWRASKLIGLDVYNNNDEKIGDINELISDQSGKIDQVVVGVGGFLGIGERNVAISWSQVKFVNEARSHTSSNASARNTTGSNADARANSGTTTTNTTATGNASASRTGDRDYPDHALVNMSKDQLKNMPAFRYVSDRR